jgi:hypothetical protein
LSRVVVGWGGGTYSNKHPGNSDGLYVFHVDVFTNAKTTTSDPGTYRAKKKLHKVLGVVRSILEDPIYKILDFEVGFIGGTYVNDIQIRDNQELDALNTAMGRVTFYVKARELNKLKDAPIIAEWRTAVHLYETEQGYLFEGISYGV